MEKTNGSLTAINGELYPIMQLMANSWLIICFSVFQWHCMGINGALTSLH